LPTLKCEHTELLLLLLYLVVQSTLKLLCVLRSRLILPSMLLRLSLVPPHPLLLLLLLLLRLF
jgi:hypothetical protein